MHEVDLFMAFLTFGESVTQLVYGRLDYVAVAVDRLLGEVVCVGVAPSAMDVVLYGGD